jgi:polysaccharide export outer membrane protein
MKFFSANTILMRGSRVAGILALTLATIFAWTTPAVFGQQTQNSNSLPPLIAAPGYTPPAPATRPVTSAPQPYTLPPAKAPANSAPANTAPAKTVAAPTPPAMANPTPVSNPAPANPPAPKPAAAVPAPRKSAKIAVKPNPPAAAPPSAASTTSQPATQPPSNGNSFDVPTVPAGSAVLPAENANDQEFPAPAQQPAYRIGVDDVLNISVWQEPDLSRTVPVRPDGKISLPLVGDVTAAGKTAMELQGELKLGLTKFVRNPELTVIVADIRSRRINVIGQVSKPGTFPLTQSMGVLEALAAAGGLRDFAKKKDIYVLRMSPDGKRQRLSYAYENVLKGKTGSNELMLQPRDTVVVP